MNGPREPYRIRVRQQHLETIDSYLRRLASANGDTIHHINWWARNLSEDNRRYPTVEMLALVAQTKGTPAEHAAPPLALHDGGCEHCIRHLGARHGCRRCGHEATVEQIPHLGRNVCRKHKLWIGPDTQPDQQTAVGAAQIVADRTFTRLARTGRADPTTTVELRTMLRRWRNRKGDTRPDAQVDAAEYPNLVRLLQLITDQRFQQHMFDPARKFSDRLNRLDTDVRRAVPSADADLVTRAALLLRPSVWAAAELAEGRTPNLPQHSLPLHPELELRGPVAEPIAEYLNLLQFTPETWSDRAETIIVLGGSDETRTAFPPKTTRKPIVLCDNGHCTDLIGVQSFSRDIAAPGCGICANQVVIVGTNDLLTVHPDLRQTLHPTKNADIDLATLSPAAKSQELWWTCPNRHEYKRLPLHQVKAEQRCPLCTRFRWAVPGENGLDITHPEIAAMYMSKNKIPVELVLSGSGRKVWWKCADGHEFEATVVSRAHHGNGCRKCSGQLAETGRTDLATVAPHLVKEWHPDNPVRPGEVHAGSQTKFLWICERGHTWHARVYRRVKGHGCHVCSKAVLVPELNSLAVTHPQLAAEWDWEGNGDLRPDQIMSGSVRKVRWLCSAGHSYERSPSGRRRGGCQYCSGHRLLPGFNDLATRFADLMPDFAWNLNPNLDPRNTLSSLTRATWRCAQGHEVEVSFRDCARTSGCGRCKRKRN